jgi:magnesium-transporting ATPase (P-type)
MVKKRWRDIQAGSIVRVDNDQAIPSDILILCTSDAKGQSYVETKNLDGETNLKLKQANKDIIEQIKDEKDFPKLSGMIICEKPNNLLYKFEGQMTLGGGKTISLNADNLMLRGCQLRNTEYIYGITVFQGPDTKIMRNSAKPKYKFS